MKLTNWVIQGGGVMFLNVIIQTNFDVDKEVMDGNKQEEYFNSDAMKDWLNDYLNESGVGIGAGNIDTWLAKRYMEEFGYVPFFRVCSVMEHHHPTCEEDEWLHDYGRSNWTRWLAENKKNPTLTFNDWLKENRNNSDTPPFFVKKKSTPTEK